MEDDLTKEETYLMLAKMIEGDAAMTVHQLNTLVALLNKDLERNANVDKIFKILDMILWKNKAQAYPRIPPLDESVELVIAHLLKTHKTAPTEKYTVYLETLFDFPDDVLHRAHNQIGASVLRIIKNHMNAEPSDPLAFPLYEFFARFSNALSDEERFAFVQQNLEFWLTDLLNFAFIEQNQNRTFVMYIMKNIMPTLLKINYFQDPNWILVADAVQDPKKYPRILVNLLKSHNSDWADLWSFLVKLCKTQLHEYGKKINPLLFALQEGFKGDSNSKYLSFHCLRVMMENFALNQRVLFNPARIKLISIALESNNAKNEEVALLKFDVWWEFILRLQSNMKPVAETVLFPFLNYCFGECRTSKSQREYPGERFESLRMPAIRALVEMFGHVDCSGCVEKNFKRLKRPLLNVELLDSERPLLLHSLKNVTLYAYRRLLASMTSDKSKTTFETLIQNLKCVWRSFVKASSGTKEDNFKCIVRTVLNIVKGFVEDHCSSPLFAEIIITIIIPSITDKTHGYSVASLQDPSNGIMHLLSPIQSILKFILLPKLYHADTMADVHFDFQNLVDITLHGNVKNNCLWLIDELSPENHSPSIWCCIVNALLDPSVDIDTELYQLVLVWPMTKYHSNVKITNVAAAWKKLITMKKSKIRQAKGKPLSQIDVDAYTHLLKMCNKTNKIGLVPLFFIPIVIKVISDEKPGNLTLINRFLVGLEKIIAHITDVNISYLAYLGLNDSLKSLTSVLLYCHTYHISSSSAESLLSVLNKTMKSIHTYFQQELKKQSPNSTEMNVSICSLLDSLNKLVIPTYLPEIVHSIIDLVNLFMNNTKNADIDTKCSQILDNLSQPDKINLNLESSELAKIRAFLVVKKNNTTVKETNASTPPNDLFPVAKTYSNNKKQVVQSKSKDIDDFVVIKSSWKFDPKNLTEHQRESLKRRRDDIPALYEDLSQSQDERIIKSWKPPGYKPTHDSSNSQECSQEVVNTCFSKNVRKSISGQSKSSDVEINSKSVTSSRQHISAMKESNGLLDANSKERVEQNLKVPEPKKMDIENVNADTKSPGGGKLAGPVTNRLNNLMKKLNSPKNKITQNSVNNDNSMNEKSSKDEVVKETTATLNKTIETNITMVIENSEQDNATKKVDDKQESTNVNEKTKKRTRKVNSIDEVSESDIKQNCTEVTNNLKVEESNEHSIAQNDTTANITSNRPARIRRKPNKFLNDEIMLDTKKSKNSTKPDEKNSQTVETPSEKIIETRKSEITTFLSPDKPTASPSTLKKKSRLMNQLAIDTNEGHPLIQINSERKNKSRRSLTAKFETSSHHKKRHSIQNAKEGEKKIETNLEKEAPSLNESVDDMKINEKSPEDAKNTITIRLKRNESQDSADTRKKIEFLNEQETPDILCDDVITPTDENEIKIENNLDDKVKSIADLDTECDSNSESSISIYSQETQFVPNLVTKKTLSDTNGDTTILLSSNDECVSVANEDISSSPDTIESSQEEENSSCTSLKTVLSKSKMKTVQMNNKPDETVDEDVHMSKLTSQEVAEADTLPLMEENPLEQSDVPSVNVSTVLQLEGDVTCNETSEILNDTRNSEHVDDSHNITCCSPLFNDIDDRNKELLNNTFDISPIKSETGANLESSIVSSPRHDLIDEKVAELLNNTVDISPIKSSPTDDQEVTTEVILASSSPDLFLSEKTSPDKEIAPSKQISPPKTTPNSTNSNPKGSRPSMKFFGTRTALLLSLCKMRNDDEKATEGDKNTIENAPNNTKCDEQQHGISDVLNNISSNGNDTVENRPLLEFTKLLPSSNASPIGPILKRKLENDDLTVSPSSKKKRVSFHDPPVSVTVDVEKYIDTKLPKSPQVKDSPAAKRNRPIVAKCLIRTMDSVGVLTNDDVLPLEEATVSDLCSLEVKSPHLMDVQKNSMLDDKLPIYPGLVECKTSILEIASRLSSPVWKDDFSKEISDRIVTIGDLAKLTELEINRLPIKYPKVDTVRQTLAAFEAESVKNRSEDKVEECQESKTDVKEDDVIERMDSTDDTTTETVKSDSPEFKEICVKNTGFELEDIFTKYTFNTILDSIPLDDVVNYLQTKIKDDVGVQNKILEKLGCHKLRSDQLERIKSVRESLKNAFDDLDDMLM